MHTVFALLCFVVVIHWLIFPYPSGLLHWHCGNLTIAPVPAKQPWWIWINTSCEFIMNDCITTTKQSTTKPCAYFLGYTVHKFESVVSKIATTLSWIDTLTRPVSILRYSLQWRHNGCDGVSNDQPHGCLLNRLFKSRSQKTSTLRVTGLCEGISLVIDELPAQRARNAENISIWWRHHVINLFCTRVCFALLDFYCTIGSFGSNLFTSILQGCSNLPLQWRHSGRHGVPIYQSLDSLFSYFLR